MLIEHFSETQTGSEGGQCRVVTKLNVVCQICCLSSIEDCFLVCKLRVVQQVAAQTGHYDIYSKWLSRGQ